ncbi:hypothetical protein B0H19DRAFT_1275053 [Mycena capillaripes]|nr:hypothetical protein B0H19DRAFT_1275053 [Mycena capillaripes]
MKAVEKSMEAWFDDEIQASSRVRALTVHLRETVLMAVYYDYYDDYDYESASYDAPEVDYAAGDFYNDVADDAVPALNYYENYGDGDSSEMPSYIDDTSPAAYDEVYEGEADELEGFGESERDDLEQKQ